MKQGWEYKKFEACINKTPKPKQVKTEEYNSGTKYPIVSQEDKLISGYYDDESYVFHIDSPVVIFGDHTRVFKYVDFDFVVGADGVKIISPKQELDAKFLLYYLQWYKIPNLGYSRHYKLLKELNIPIPPKSTQLTIVSELDKINELIRLKKEQLKDYDNLAQSIFYEMFGDPVENEKGWEVKKWKDVFNTILGKMLDKSKQINHLKQYKYLANMNVQWGYFDLKELRSMTFTDEELAKYELRNNDLLICEGGDAGRCAIWKETDETILFQKAIHRARLIDTDNADVVYIRYWMQFYKVNKGLKDYISKSTIEHLTGDKLKRLPIPLPPLPLQHLFAQRIEQIEHQKSAVAKAITDLETLLASRMQHWFE